MVAVVLKFESPKAQENQPRPWLNHELAELYRVVDLLGQSGLELATDMGMTDEGDPWFVFCRADTGDVVFHIARIGRQYIAASATIDRTCRGANFRDIIDQLIHQQPLVMPRQPNGGKLFVHPAAMLAAFIASALIHSHRAEAADLIGSAISVTFDADKADKSDHRDGSHTPSKVHYPDAPRTQSDKILAKLQGASEQASSLASLIAVAYAAFAPLVTQDLISHAVASEISATTSASTQAAALMANQVDGKSADDLVSVAPPVHHEETSAHSSPTLLAAHDTLSLTSLTTAAALTPLVVLKSDLIALQANQPLSFAEPLFVHTLAHQSAPTQDGSAVALSTGSQSISTTTTPDQTHHVDISTVDPIALAVFLPHTNQAQGSAGSTTGGSTGTAGHTDVPPPTVTQPSSTPIIQVSTANDLIDQLSAFAASPQHSLSGQLNPSAALAAFLSDYAATNGPNVEILVFDSSSISLNIFPFVKGVVIVDDHQLASDPQLLHAASPVTLEFADGGLMKLIGIINVDATHPFAGIA